MEEENLAVFLLALALPGKAGYPAYKASSNFQFLQLSNMDCRPAALQESSRDSRLDRHCRDRQVQGLSHYWNLSLLV